MSNALWFGILVGVLVGTFATPVGEDRSLRGHSAARCPDRFGEGQARVGLVPVYCLPYRFRAS